jgi:glycosyltransferase involved in cell wall biosynthesis
MLYPGTLSYHQGLDIAIRAFSLIKDEVPNAEFHTYGGGDQEETLKSLVVELGLQDRVFLKGAILTEEVPAVIENADLGIVPKRKSGFGNEAFSTKILEFMAMGVPVIVADTTIDKYYFNDSVVQFFQGEDQRSLADAMLRLFHNAVLRERLVRNAKEFVKKYTWGANQGVYLDVVDALVGSKNGHKRQL